MREITAKFESHVYFSSPNWKKGYKRRVVDGMNGEDGKDGINGPDGKSRVFSYVRIFLRPPLLGDQFSKIPRGSKSNHHIWNFS